MFNRKVARLTEVELPQLGQDSDLEVAWEVGRRTNIEQARKWRNKAKIERKNQRVKIKQLVWVKIDYTTSLSDRKFGVKWLGLYKVKKVLRNGGEYRLENVFDGVRIQMAADEVKPCVGKKEF